MDLNTSNKDLVCVGVGGSSSVGKSWDLPGMSVISDDSCPNSPEPIASVGPIYIRQIFKTKSELKGVVGLYALRKYFEIRVKKSCNKRYEVGCKGKSCKFRIVAKRIVATECWQIREFKSDHTCGYEGTSSHTASVQTIGSLMASRLETNGVQLKANQIISDVKNDYGIVCQYSKAWRSKEFANSLVYGSPEDSFDLLRRYFYVLEQNNPGTKTFVEVDEEHRFKCCFWAFGASINGASSLRHVVAIDGTHLKGTFKGVLFVAVGLDANGRTYPLGFGIGHKEDEFYWSWFLSKLRVSYGCPDNLVLVSDQHKAIKLACEKIYPEAWHGLCGFHLGKNLNKDFKNKSLVTFFTPARECYKATEFEYNMEQLKNVSEKAYDFLMKLDPKKWARSKSPRNRFNILTSNIAESLNARLKDARKRPVTVLCEEVRSMMQKWFFERRRIAYSSTKVLAPKFNKFVNRNFRSGRFLQVAPINQNEVQVKDDNTDEVVNLAERTCSCMAFQFDLFVCKHAAAAIMHSRRDIDSFCSDYYKVESMKLQYADSIRPVGGPDDWVIPNDIFLEVIGAPMWRGQAGRPREKRIRSAWEGKSKKSKMKKTCSLCHAIGHYRQNCPNGGASSSSATLLDTTIPTHVIGKKKRACSLCRKTGHRKNTCPMALP